MPILILTITNGEATFTRAFATDASAMQWHAAHTHELRAFLRDIGVPARRLTNEHIASILAMMMASVNAHGDSIEGPEGEFFVSLQRTDLQ